MSQENQSQPENHRQPWHPHEDRKLAQAWGFLPVDEIAALHGRTETAVQLRAILLGIPYVLHHDNVMTTADIADAFGMVDLRTARRFMRGRSWSGCVYQGRREVLVAYRDKLARWLRDPLNWRDFDEGRVVDAEFRRIIRKASGDRWLTISEAADHASYTREGIKSAIYQGRLPADWGTKGQKGKRRRLIKLSVLDGFLKHGRWDDE